MAAFPRNDGAARPGAPGREQSRTWILDGETVQPTPRVAGPRYDPDRPEPLWVLRGRDGAINFNTSTLSKHVLFLGSIGTGKTNAMMQLVAALRAKAGPGDVFVVFDTKGDFHRNFSTDGDRVLSSAGDGHPGGVIWNLFRDLLVGDPAARGDQVFEIASTIFSEDLSKAGENMFFAAGACDIFAAVTQIMAEEGVAYSNADLREFLERSQDDLYDLISGKPGFSGTARYLDGERSSQAVLAFLQQAVNKSFSGVFRKAGDFSVRDFIQKKGGRALFIEYDVAMGRRLLPVYRVLLDMAIKEALALGRQSAPGNVYFVMDEFALLPHLSHIGEGINFGRDLGLKFLVATQNVNQVLEAYGPGEGRSLLSGFGTVAAFRLMDTSSRELVRDRFGTNRVKISTYAPVRADGVQELVATGHVIEDWVLSGLRPGESIVSLPQGPPFFFTFDEYPIR